MGGIVYPGAVRIKAGCPIRRRHHRTSFLGVQLSVGIGYSGSGQVEINPARLPKCSMVSFHLRKGSDGEQQQGNEGPGRFPR